MGKISINEISKLANVSTATVSRVLNGSSHVSESTRERVLTIIRQTNYVPNVFAQGLKRDSSRTIGIMCPDIQDMYMTRALFYIQRRLSAYDYSSLLNCTGYELEDKKLGMELLLSKRVDAVVLVGSSFTEVNSEDNRYILEAAKKVPVVYLNGYLKGDNIYNVFCDEAEGTYRAAKTLIQAGVNGKRVIYLYNRETYSNKQKIKGFLTAMLENDQAVFANAVQLCPYDQVDQILDEWVLGGGLEDRLGGVMTSGDGLAMRVLKYFRKGNILVPDQVQVVGYSNTDFGQFCVPELTSVDSCVSELSEETVEILLKVLNGQEVDSEVCMSARIIPRESTRKRFKELADHEKE